MSEQPRYSLTPGGVALTRVQWVVVVVVLVVGLVGLILVFVSPALSGGLLGLAGLVTGLLALSARPARAMGGTRVPLFEAGRHFGPTRRQALSEVAMMMLAVVAAHLLVRGRSDPYLLVPALLGVSVAAAVLWPLTLRQGLTVDAHGVSVRRGYRNRRASWSELDTIEVRRNWAGLRRLVLTGQTAVLKPPYPSHHPLAPDREFDDKVTQIRQWAAAAGAAGG